MNMTHEAIGLRTDVQKQALRDESAVIGGTIAAVRLMIQEHILGETLDWSRIDCILGTAQAAADGLHRRILCIVGEDDEVTETPNG